MTKEDSEKVKFPIGPFIARENITNADIDSFVQTIASAPADYEALTRNVSNDDLNKTYREGAWSVRQLVHHVADIQLLHLFRMKKALTESDYKDVTLINMDGWAKTADSVTAPVADSVDMFRSITRRYVHLLRSLDEKQLQIAYYHPVRKVMLSQKQAISMSAWHVRHHKEHIRIALNLA